MKIFEICYGCCSIATFKNSKYELCVGEELGKLSSFGHPSVFPVLHDKEANVRMILREKKRI